jgi:thiol-disulfide isomerase/thioredoxin
MNATQLVLAAVLAGATGAPMQTSVQPPVEDELASLGKATEWINSPPLTPASLRGKVVLVEFGTYTCINWLRTLPYVRAWADKYKDEGLVVIQVHAPEFEFEKDLANVRSSLKQLGVSLPVAVDNEHAIWRAFNNQYWPALYFIDGKGRIRHHHFGEGEYPASERVIRELLAEAGKSGNGSGDAKAEGQGIEAAADWASLRSPENYLGYERTVNFASPGGVADQRHAYTAPARLKLNHWALAGSWTIGKQATALHQANGRIVYRFHARDLHLVMGPEVRGAPVRFRVTIDGEPPGAAHGLDVDEQGVGTVTTQRLYQLIRQPRPIADRLFEIEFLDPGVEAFAFTFG